ncbi:MAG: hypothetical protein AAF235_11220, partial [Planctomycetota bacterium]
PRPPPQDHPPKTRRQKPAAAMNTVVYATRQAELQAELRAKTSRRPRPPTVAMSMRAVTAAMCFFVADRSIGNAAQGQSIFEQAERIDAGVADRGPSAQSLRSLQPDLLQPRDFNDVFRLPGGSLARVDNGLTAIFPRSVYAQSFRGAVPVVPPDTRFVIGDPPAWLAEHLAGPPLSGGYNQGSTAQLAGSTAGPIRIDARIAPAELAHQPATPSRDVSVKQAPVGIAETSRAGATPRSLDRLSVRSLLGRAAAAEMNRDQRPARGQR